MKERLNCFNNEKKNERWKTDNNYLTTWVVGISEENKIKIGAEQKMVL